MARINSALLVYNATTLGHRAQQVQQDPAVRKAWSVAGEDAAKAVQSVAAAAFETRSAWRRTAPGLGTDRSGLYA